MALTLSVFDLFTYAVPGAMQLALLAYVALRLDLVEPAAVQTAPGWLLALGVVLASYLLGHVTFRVVAVFSRILRLGGRAERAARRHVARRLPPGAPSLPTVDVHLLLVAVELRDRFIAAEIARMRAVGLMLRSAAVPVFLGACVAFAEVAGAGNRWVPVAWGIALSVCAVAIVRQGAVVRRWAASKTFEAFYWLQVGGAPATAEETDLPAVKLDDAGVVA